MTANKKKNIFLRLQPMQRVLLSIAMAILAYIFIRNKLDVIPTISLLWVTFATSFIVCSWIVFFKLPVDEIIKKANKEDGSRLFVFLSILVSAFASMFAVLLLLISDEVPGMETVTAIIAVSGMIASWILVHTIFTFHYAHLYYFKGKDDTPDSEALDFPGKTQPDYIDFAYFSFVIGMTFQVSDVEICSRIVRRTSLAHALLSFALNTFVVALTINLIAGLKK